MLQFVYNTAATNTHSAIQMCLYYSQTYPANSGNINSAYELWSTTRTNFTRTVGKSHKNSGQTLIELQINLQKMGLPHFLYSTLSQVTTHNLTYSVFRSKMIITSKYILAAKQYPDNGSICFSPIL